MSTLLMQKRRSTVTLGNANATSRNGSVLKGGTQRLRPINGSKAPEDNYMVSFIEKLQKDPEYYRMFMEEAKSRGVVPKEKVAAA